MFNWIELLTVAIPIVLLIAGTPHLVRALRESAWRILHISLIVGLATYLWAKPMSVAQSGAAHAPTEVQSWTAFIGILLVLTLVLLARGYRIFAFGLALAIAMFGNAIAPYLTTANLIRVLLLITLVFAIRFLYMSFRSRTNSTDNRAAKT